MKFNKIFSILSCVALMLAAWSCNDEMKYEPAPEWDGYNVYFASQDYKTQVVLVQDQSEFLVPVYRLEKEELTVTLSATVTADKEYADVNIFTLPTSVTIDEGATMTSIKVGVDFAKVEPSVTYTIVYTIDDEFTTPYGNSQIFLNVSYAPWSNFEPVSKNHEYGGGTLSAFGFSDDEITVYYQESLIAPLIRYQFGDYGCPDLNPDEDEWTWVVNGYNFTFVRDTNTNSVTMEPSPTGDTGSFGTMLYVSDVYTWAVAHPDLAVLSGIDNPEAFANASYFDPRTGVFEIAMVYYIEGSTPRLITSAYEYYYLPGYTEYILELKKVGSFVDNSGAEQVVISAYKNEEVASFSYALYNGTLSSAEENDGYQAIAANPENSITDTQANIALSLEEEGAYTLLAVGFDAAGDAVVTAKCEFTYESVSKPSEFEPLGKALYTDGFLYPYYGGNLGGTTWEVEVEQHKTQPGIIRLVNPYNSLYWDEGHADWDLTGNYYITINMEVEDQVYIYESKLGIELHPNDGPIWVSSLAYDSMMNGTEDQRMTAEECAEYGLFGKIEDGYITFPGCALLTAFGDANAAAGQWYYANIDMDLMAADGDKIVLANQLKSTGWFELDLSDIYNVAKAKKHAPAKHTATKAIDRNVAKYNGRGAAVKTISGKELMMYNAKHGVNFSR